MNWYVVCRWDEVRDMTKRTKQDWARLFEDYEDFRQSHSEVAEPHEYVDARKLSVTSLLLYDFMKLDWVGSDGFGYRPEKIFTNR